MALQKGLQHGKTQFKASFESVNWTKYKQIFGIETELRKIIHLGYPKDLRDGKHDAVIYLAKQKDRHFIRELQRFVRENIEGIRTLLMAGAGNDAEVDAIRNRDLENITVDVLVLLNINGYNKTNLTSELAFVANVWRALDTQIRNSTIFKLYIKAALRQMDRVTLADVEEEERKGKN